MKAFGHEFFMRYCWEMDGSRKQGTVKGPKQFIEAWRHMYRIFQEEGATNVIWTWTANAAGFKDKRKYTNNEPPGPYFYPGDEYVDWIAADGYNWGVSKRNQGDRWRQVLEIFDEFMIFARAHPKPIMIGEYGAQEQSEDPAAKPEWMRHAHDVLMNKPKTPECKHCGAYSDVAAVVYFDVDYGSHGDWRIMSSDRDPDGLQGGVGRPLVPPDGHRFRGRRRCTGRTPRARRPSTARGGSRANRTRRVRRRTRTARRRDHSVARAQAEPGDGTAGQADPGSPAQDQSGQPSQSGPPPDQSSPPPDQTSESPDQGNQSDRAGQDDRSNRNDSGDQDGQPPSAKTQKPESGKKGKKNR